MEFFWSRHDAKSYGVILNFLRLEFLIIFEICFYNLKLNKKKINIFILNLKDFYSIFYLISIISIILYYYIAL